MKDFKHSIKMRCFSKDESIFGVVTKIITVVGILFGIWAYFHSIRPVFQKEKEYLELQAKNSQLLFDRRTIENEISVAKKELSGLLNEQKQLKTEKLALSGLVSEANEVLKSYRDQIEVQKKTILEKEERVNKLLGENDKAGYFAVQYKLESMTNRLVDKYLMSIQSGGTQFNPRNEALEIVNFENNKSSVSTFERQAIEFFEKYVSTKLSNDMPKDKIVEGIVGIPFEYQIEVVVPAMYDKKTK